MADSPREEGEAVGASELVLRLRKTSGASRTKAPASTKIKTEEMAGKLSKDLRTKIPTEAAVEVVQPPHLKVTSKPKEATQPRLTDRRTKTLTDANKSESSSPTSERIKDPQPATSLSSSRPQGRPARKLFPPETVRRNRNKG